MSLVPDDQERNTDTAAKPPIKLKESADVVAFIDHYLALADTLLAPNVEKQDSGEKSEPYVDHHESINHSAGPDSTS